jgi:hypothetical protein
VPSVSFEIADVEYEVEVDSYTHGSPATYDDPGDGGEIELALFVDYKVGDEWETIPWGLFVLTFAPDRGVPLDKADAIIYDEAIEQTQEYYAEREE